MEPVGAVRYRPRLVAVSVQVMDGNDARALSVRALMVVQMAYSTTDCSPSATTLRPMADALDGCCGFDELPVCRSVSLTEAEYWGRQVRRRDDPCETGSVVAIQRQPALIGSKLRFRRDFMSV